MDSLLQPGSINGYRHKNDTGDSDVLESYQAYRASSIASSRFTWRNSKIQGLLTDKKKT